MQSDYCFLVQPLQMLVDLELKPRYDYSARTQEAALPPILNFLLAFGM